MAVYVIIVFLGFLVYFTYDNIKDDFSYKKDLIVYFSYNFAEVTGKLALAFHVHNTLVDICSETKNLNDNQGIIRNSCIFSCFVYIFTGVAGSLALLGKTSDGGFLFYNYLDK